MEEDNSFSAKRRTFCRLSRTSNRVWLIGLLRWVESFLHFSVGRDCSAAPNVEHCWPPTNTWNQRVSSVQLDRRFCSGVRSTSITARSIIGSWRPDRISSETSTAKAATRVSAGCTNTRSYRTKCTRREKWSSSKDSLLKSTTQSSAWTQIAKASSRVRIGILLRTTVDAQFQEILHNV